MVDLTSSDEDEDVHEQVSLLQPARDGLNGTEVHGVPSSASGVPASALGSTIARIARTSVSCVWDSGLASVSAAALIFSLGALLVKLASATIPVLEIVLVRSAVSLSIVGVSLWVRGVRPIIGHRRNWGKLAARGLCGCTAMTLYYIGLFELPLADATTIFFLNPVLTALLAWAVRGEALGWRGMAGCAASLAGVALVAHPPFLFGGHEQWGPARMLGTGCMIASALFAAVSFIAIRSIGRSEPSLVVSLWFHVTSLLASCVPLACSFPQAAVLPRPVEVGMLLGVALTSFAGQLFITRGFQLEVASKVAAVNYMQVVYAYIFGWALLGNTFSLLGVAGSALVAAGVIATTQDKAAAKDERSVQLSQLQAAATPALNRDFSEVSLAVRDSTAGNGCAPTRRQQQGNPPAGAFALASDEDDDASPAGQGVVAAYRPRGGMDVEDGLGMRQKAPLPGASAVGQPKPMAASRV